MKTFSTYFALSVLGLSVLGVPATNLRAMDEPIAFTVDLPFQANAATPAWLGHPVTAVRDFATLDLPVIPPDAAASLLVTVFFTEKEGGFLRVTWQGEAGTAAQVLSNNFYEGTGMSTQRSLLVPSDTLGGEGTLTFQCGGATLDIQRVQLEWLENKNSLVSPRVDDLLVTASNHLTKAASELGGEPPQVNSAAWNGQVVTVPITDTPQRIEAGVEFNVQLDSVPSAGRLALKEEGLSWGKHLVVWVNQQRAGTITPAVPDLLDDGFLPDPATATGYIGWRDGSVYLPVSVLKTGVNALQFSIEDDVASPTTTTVSDPATLPLAVKDVTIQLVYPPSTSVPAPESAAPPDTNLPAATPPPTPSTP